MTSTFRTGLLLALLVIAIDQLTKWLVLESLDLAANPIAVTSFFDMVLVWNRGVSFGMFSEAGSAGPWILTGLAILVVIGLLYWLRQAEGWVTIAGLAWSSAALSAM